MMTKSSFYTLITFSMEENSTFLVIESVPFTIFSTNFYMLFLEADLNTKTLVL